MAAISRPRVPSVAALYAVGRVICSQTETGGAIERVATLVQELKQIISVYTEQTEDEEASGGLIDERNL